MPISYDDKRNRYKGLAPSDFAAGNPKFDNPVKPRADIVYSRPAIGRKVGDAFRVTTAPKPEPPAPMPVAPHVEPVPDADKNELGSVSILHAADVDKPEL